MDIPKSDLSREVINPEIINVDNDTAQMDQLMAAKADLSEKLFKYRLKKFRFAAAAILFCFAFSAAGILSDTALAIFVLLVLAAIVVYVIVG